MAGRRPKPTHLRVVSGNAGKRPLNKAEPQPRRERPSPPAHLSGAARDAWGYVSGILDRMGVLTEADAVALEQLCECYAEIVELRAEIAENGRFQTVATKAGGEMERLRPAYAALMDADRRLKAWLAEFGMTPSARSRITANPPDQKEDPASRFFG